MSELIRLEDVQVRFRIKSRKLLELKPTYFDALDGINLSIQKGETYGLVGESGSGKSTIGRAILGYLKPHGGTVYYEDTAISTMDEKKRKPYMKKMQSIFQDPYSSLDPSMSIGEIISEPMKIHHLYSAQERREHVLEMLEAVGLEKEDYERYPYEFSGGQRQRISIARAISVNPEFIVCDEPISALDVSLQAQIVYLLEKLREEHGLTYLFISHQLQIVEKICDRIGVLYLGRFMEEGSAEEISSKPLHPYTQMLMASVPWPDPDIKNLEHITNDSGVQQYEGKGCRFANRCPHATERCKAEVPGFYQVSEGHRVACFMFEIQK